MIIIIKTKVTKAMLNSNKGLTLGKIIISATELTPIDKAIAKSINNRTSNLILFFMLRCSIN